MQLHLVVTKFSILLRVLCRLVSSYCAALQSLGVVARMMVDHERAVAFRHHMHATALQHFWSSASTQVSKHAH